MLVSAGLDNVASPLACRRMTMWTRHHLPLQVFMSPNLQQGASGTGAAAMLKDADKRQSVAVFSKHPGC